MNWRVNVVYFNSRAGRRDQVGERTKRTEDVMEEREGEKRPRYRRTLR